MANVIGEFVAKIGADSKPFNQGVDKADTRMGRFAQSINKHKKMIAAAFVAIGAASAAVAGKIIKDWAAAGNEVHKMALRTGFATETLSELKHAAEISGASINSLEKGVKRMQMQILDANRGLKESLDNLRDLGVTLDDLEGKAPEEQFRILTEALAEVEDATTRAGIAQKLFGRSGAELLPMLAEGKEGIKALREEAHELGIVFDQDAANAAAKLTDEMDRMNKSLMGLKFAFAEEMAPALTSFITSLSQFIRGDDMVTFGKEGHAVNAIIEAQAVAFKENEKAIAGEDNQMKEAIVTLKEAYEAWYAVTERTLENNMVMSEAVTPLREWLKEYDRLVVASENRVNAIRSEIASNDMHDANMQKLLKTMEAMKEAELELAKTVEEAERRKRWARRQQAFGLAASIIEGGGTLSPSRILAMGLQQIGIDPGMVTPGGADILDQSQVLPSGGAAPIIVQGTMEIDGEKVGDFVMGESGKTYSEQQEMGG